MTDSKAQIMTLAGGLSAGLLFFMSLHGLSNSLLFFYLPLLPLFLVFFRYGFRAMGLAAIMAMVPALVLTGIGGLVLFACLEAAPALLLAHGLSLWREEEAQIHWYPAGRGVARLSVYAAGLFLLVALHYSHNEGGLLAAVQQQFRQGLSGVSAEYAAPVEQLIGRLPALIFAASAWVFALVVYANAWFAHFILKERVTLARERVGITRFSPPWWLLALLVAAALASLQRDAADAFIGRTVFLTLLLPYFLSGVATIHALSRPWAGRPWVLAGFYLLILATLWPALAIAGIGLWEQLRSLSRRKRGETSDFK